MTEIMLADLERKDLERLVVHLQGRDRRLRAYLADLTRRSDWLTRHLAEFESREPAVPALITTAITHGVRREIPDMVARRRAVDNDRNVWERFE